MAPNDPATGQPLDSEYAIQRVLFATTDVHVYGIPPISSNKGFSASSWTSPTQPTAQQIFTARLRVIETSVEDTIKVDVVLEDPASGDLFAAAPYTSAAIVQSALDSSRFFALRVQGEGGMKATLGIGFEDRSPAFDFGVALGEARKVMGWESTTAAARAGKNSEATSSVNDRKEDFSLKEGQHIHIELGGKGRRVVPYDTGEKPDDGTALFSIAPPPPYEHTQVPSATANAPPSRDAKSARELGFDDGEFGEFQ